VIGSLVHEALAAWYFPDNHYDNWVRARARSYGITNSTILDTACRQTRLLLERFQKDDLYQQMEGADRRLHELPYSLELKGRIERGIIDAIFLRDKVWTIVEFKTDKLRDDEFHRVPAMKVYKRQVKRYALAAQRLLGQRPRVILCMLNVADQVRKVHLT
jgi:ATP-dependent exoDNAse (exonuclease V) beta subunit